LQGWAINFASGSLEKAAFSGYIGRHIYLAKKAERLSSQVPQRIVVTF